MTVQRRDTLTMIHDRNSLRYVTPSSHFFFSHVSCLAKLSLPRIPRASGDCHYQQVGWRARPRQIIVIVWRSASNTIDLRSTFTLHIMYPRTRWEENCQECPREYRLRDSLKLPIMIHCHLTITNAEDVSSREDCHHVSLDRCFLRSPRSTRILFWIRITRCRLSGRQSYVVA